MLNIIFTWNCVIVSRWLRAECRCLCAFVTCSVCTCVCQYVRKILTENKNYVIPRPRNGKCNIQKDAIHLLATQAFAFSYRVRYVVAIHNPWH